MRRRKRTGGYRLLKLSTIVHRCICKATEIAVGWIINATLLPSVHGYRPRRSVHTLLADLERVIVQEDRWVLTTEDVQDCFPSIPLNLAASSVSQILGHRLLMNFVLNLIRGNEGGQRTVGLDQGNPLSPTVMNAVLHFALDSPYQESSANPPLWRYADNLVVATHTVAEGQQAVILLGDLLAQNAMRSKRSGRPAHRPPRAWSLSNLTGVWAATRSGRAPVHTPSRGLGGPQRQTGEGPPERRLSPTSWERCSRVGKHLGHGL